MTYCMNCGKVMTDVGSKTRYCYECIRSKQSAAQRLTVLKMIVRIRRKEDGSKNN